MRRTKTVLTGRLLGGVGYACFRRRTTPGGRRGEPADDVQRRRLPRIPTDRAGRRLAVPDIEIEGVQSHHVTEISTKLLLTPRSSIALVFSPVSAAGAARSSSTGKLAMLSALRARALAWMASTSATMR